QLIFLGYLHPRVRQAKVPAHACSQDARRRRGLLLPYLGRSARSHLPARQVEDAGAVAHPGHLHHRPAARQLHVVRMCGNGQHVEFHRASVRSFDSGAKMWQDNTRRHRKEVRMPPLPLQGQVAVVTGAAKRIGRSIAMKLAAEGANVIINYATSQAEAEKLAQQISGDGRRAIALQADVSRRADVQRMFATVEKEFGRLDLLVNNAGKFFSAAFEDLTEEQWDSILDANLKSQFLCAQAAAPIMKRQGRGRIINISSLGGLLAWPKYTHYCVS